MKVVPDAMIWVSYTTHRDGPRRRALELAVSQRVRLFTSGYILSEASKALTEAFAKPPRYVASARRAILRVAEEVQLPPNIRAYVPGDPNDDAVIQTALTAGSDYVVTADKVLLALSQVQDVRIIGLDDFVALLSSTG